MDYKTDGELYYDCLTAQSKEQVLSIYQGIIDMIDKFGFVTISDVVCLTKKGGIKNWAYAVTHGWNRSDIVNFTMKYDKSKGWQIFLGNPRLLVNTKKGGNSFKKYLVVLSPRTQIPEYGWESALVRVRLYVYAPDTKEARKTAIQVMENHHLYCKVTYIREMKGETKMDEATVLFKCLWCGWKGTSDDMDFDEHDEPAYCPECGHSSFDIREMKGETK